MRSEKAMSGEYSAKLIKIKVDDFLVFISGYIV